MVYALKVLVVIEVLFAAGLFLFRATLAPDRRRIVSGGVVAAVMLTPVVALFCRNYYLFLLYLVGVVAVASASRNRAAGIYVVLVPLMPVLSQETGAGGIYLLALSAPLALGLGALTAFLIGGDRRRLIAPGRSDLAMAALILLLTFMFAHSLSPTSLLRGFTAYLLGLGGPYLLLSRAVRDRADLDRLLLLLLLGAALTAGTAIFQAGWHWVLFENYYRSLGIRSPVMGSFSLSMRAGLLRTGGAINDYSVGGVYLAAMVTLFPLLRRHFSALGFWVVLAGLVGGLFATQSRGGWLAAIVGFVVVAAIRRQWGRVVLLGGGALAAELAILTFARSGRLADMLGKGQDTKNVDYRQDLLTQGLDQIKAHPLFGQPTDRLIANMSGLRQGEGIVDFVNGHLYVAMTAGVPLFLLWCIVWIAPVVVGWQMWARTRSDLAAVPAALIVPAMTALTFTSIGDRNLHWPTLALALSAACFQLARATSQPSGTRAAPTGAARLRGPSAQAAAIA